MKLLSHATELLAPTAAVCVLRRHGDGRYLLGQSTADDDRAGKWCFPGGHVEPEEAPASAGCRECQEETGLAPHARDDPFHMPDNTAVVYVPCEVTHDKSTPRPNGEFSNMAWFTTREMRQLPDLHHNVLAVITKARGFDDADFGLSSFDESKHPRDKEGRFAPREVMDLRSPFNYEGYQAIRNPTPGDLRKLISHKAADRTVRYVGNAKTGDVYVIPSHHAIHGDFAAALRKAGEEVPFEYDWGIGKGSKEKTGAGGYVHENNGKFKAERTYGKVHGVKVHAHMKRIVDKLVKQEKEFAKLSNEDEQRDENGRWTVTVSELPVAKVREALDASRKAARRSAEVGDRKLRSDAELAVDEARRGYHSSAAVRHAELSRQHGVASRALSGHMLGGRHGLAMQAHETAKNKLVKLEQLWREISEQGEGDVTLSIIRELELAWDESKHPRVRGKFTVAVQPSGISDSASMMRHPVEVLRNPDRRMVLGMIDEHRSALRSTVDRATGDVYAWPAIVGRYADVERALKDTHYVRGANGVYRRDDTGNLIYRRMDKERRRSHRPALDVAGGMEEKRI